MSGADSGAIFDLWVVGVLTALVVLLFVLRFIARWALR